jgi:MoaA/NifB/PqqE/SkfB family radical SAM enzyme
MRIDPAGKVTQCCWGRFDTAGLGNVLEQSLEEIWNGPVAQAVRAATLLGQLHYECTDRSCPFQIHPRTDYPVKVYPWPTSLNIDCPNTMCNTACMMCPRADPKVVWHQDRLDEIVPRLRPLMSGLSALLIMGLAEVFWKGLLHRVLDLLGFDDHARHITLEVITNGSTFDAAERARFIARVPLAQVSISLDAATPETFNLIRRLDWDTVLGNFRAYGAERPRSHRLVMLNNINLLNVHEAADMVSIAKEIGCDEIMFQPTVNIARPIMGLTMYDHAQDRRMGAVFRRAHDEAVARGQRVGIPTKFVKALDLGLAGGAALPRYNEAPAVVQIEAPAASSSGPSAAALAE